MRLIAGLMCILAAAVVLVACGDDKGPTAPVVVDPPFGGTIFIDPDIITSSDPTTFVSLTPAGQGSRTMYDRRVNDWITVDAFLFDASFDDGLSAEIQVNPEFGTVGAAEAEASKYAPVIGRLPTVLRSVASGAAGSWSLSNLGPRIIDNRFDPGFFVEHFVKDMGIALEESRRRMEPLDPERAAGILEEMTDTIKELTKSLDDSLKACKAVLEIVLRDGKLHGLLPNSLNSVSSLSRTLAERTDRAQVATTSGSLDLSQRSGSCHSAEPPALGTLGEEVYHGRPD